MQTVITLSAALAAIIAIAGYLGKINGWIARQSGQDTDIKSLKTEQAIMMRGILACLQGLAEQGCDGPVHSAIDEINAYLNEKAHE